MPSTNIPYTAVVQTLQVMQTDPLSHNSEVYHIHPIRIPDKNPTEESPDDVQITRLLQFLSNTFHSRQVHSDAVELRHCETAAACHISQTSHIQTYNLSKMLLCKWKAF